MKKIVLTFEAGNFLGFISQAHQQAGNTHTDRTWDSSFVTFSYTNLIGKNTVARARQRNSGVEDEKRRAN